MTRLRSSDLQRDLLAEALTSEHPHRRLFARLTASAASETMEAFIESERARGSDPNHILNAFAKWAGQVAGSILFALFEDPDGEDELVESFAPIVECFGTALVRNYMLQAADRAKRTPSSPASPAVPDEAAP